MFMKKTVGVVIVTTELQLSVLPYKQNRNGNNNEIMHSKCYGLYDSC